MLNNLPCYVGVRLSGKFKYVSYVYVDETYGLIW